MSRTLIIAEAGVNHNGDINLAKKLIDAAALAGADYVKFQTFKAENLVSKDAIKADYQVQNTNNNDTQFAMLKALELSDENHFELIAYCKQKEIKFLSTAFDLESVEFLKDKIDFYKIPSGEITNLPYLESVSKLQLPIIMSTGMANLKEVKAAFDVLIKNGVQKNDITILHCNTEYPTPMKDVNLLAMNQIAREIGVKVGYSDHTLGIEVAIAAVALGATVIEKHFTTDRNLPGPDHAASLEPEELKAMVQAIRNIEIAIAGSGIKEASESEKKNIAVARKSIHTARKLALGHVLTKEDIIVLRPGDGISAMEIDTVIGKKLTKDVAKAYKLSKTDLDD